MQRFRSLLKSKGSQKNILNGIDLKDLDTNTLKIQIWI